MVSSGEGNGEEDARCIRLAVFLFSVLCSCILFLFCLPVSNFVLSVLRIKSQHLRFQKQSVPIVAS